VRRKEAVIHEISRSSVTFRLEQYVVDGNHRTSTLLIYEYLSTFNMRLDYHPLLIYLLLSLGEELGLHQTATTLANFISKHVSNSGVTEAYRNDYRRKIKEEIPLLATQIYQIRLSLSNRTKDLDERRKAYRWLKREHTWLWRGLHILVTLDGQVIWYV
jgi:hypothetical protein